MTNDNEKLSCNCCEDIHWGEKCIGAHAHLVDCKLRPFIFAQEEKKASCCYKNDDCPICPKVSSPIQSVEKRECDCPAKNDKTSFHDIDCSVIKNKVRENILSFPTQSVEEKQCKCGNKLPSYFTIPEDFKLSCENCVSPTQDWATELSIEMAQFPINEEQFENIKSFISQTITKAKEEERDKCIEIIKKDAQQKGRNSEELEHSQWIIKFLQSNGEEK